jgi:hypothetical protein
MVTPNLPAAQAGCKTRSRAILDHLLGPARACNISATAESRTSWNARLASTATFA